MVIQILCSVRYRVRVSVIRKKCHIISMICNININEYQLLLYTYIYIYVYLFIYIS